MMFGLSNDFTCALLGGGFMAAATSFNLLMTGRITGMSSILASIITGKSDFRWKFTAVTAIVSTALLSYKHFEAKSGVVSIPLMGERLLVELCDKRVLHSSTVVLLGGVLVGLGVRMGNGCTSGHGLCGLPRLSKRSIAAVSIFMSVAMTTATVLDKYPIIPKIEFIESLGSEFSTNLLDYTNYILALSHLAMLCFWSQKPKVLKEFIVSYITGVVFGVGVFLSGMTRVSKILGFLTVNEHWDPTLMLVMASGVGINLITFNLITQMSGPVLAPSFSIPAKTAIDEKLILGAVVYGLGWGISGTCVGPALAISLLAKNGLFSLGSIALGMYLYELLPKYDFFKIKIC